MSFLAAAFLLQAAPETLDRGVIALGRGDGSVYVGWRLLASDPPDVGFRVYRKAGDAEPVELTKEPLKTSTNLIDPAPPAGASYRVRAGDGPLSAPAEVSNRDGKPYVRIALDPGVTAFRCAVADLDGDGRYDFIVKHPNHNTDPYEKYWKPSPSTYKLDACGADGRKLWRYDMGPAIEAGVWYSPVVAYDLDGDGKAEVFVKAGETDKKVGEQVTEGPEWVVRLDGLTGKPVAKADWPDRSGFEGYNRWSRNMLAVGWLDGARPSLVIVRGTYTLIKVRAMDGALKTAWDWAAEGAYRGQGLHGVHAADLDGDGKDEILYGAAAVRGDGKPMWTLGMGHPDVCYVGDIDPARPGLEIFYGFETRQEKNGLCLVEAATGKILWGWDGPTRHIHGQGMVADIDPAHPGQECFGGERDFELYWLYSAQGKRIGDQKLRGNRLDPRAVWWDNSPQKAFVEDVGIQGRVLLIADLFGDWREEVVTAAEGELRVWSTTALATSRRTCLMQDRHYRSGVANTALSGYYYPPQLGHVTK